jgi:DnaJ homolog subfamily C member 2
MQKILKKLVSLSENMTVLDRKKVLKHHPDKKGADRVSESDNFFKCVQKGLFSLLP